MCQIIWLYSFIGFNTLLDLFGISIWTVILFATYLFPIRTFHLVACLLIFWTHTFELKESVTNHSPQIKGLGSFFFFILLFLVPLFLYPPKYILFLLFSYISRNYLDLPICWSFSFFSIASSCLHLVSGFNSLPSEEHSLIFFPVKVCKW